MTRLLRILIAAPLLPVLACADGQLLGADAARWIRIRSGRSGNWDVPPTGVADVLALAAVSAEFRSVLYYRARRSPLGKALASVYGLVYRGAPGLLIGAESIGPGLYIEHGFGTIVANARIGRDFWINQGATIAFGTTAPTVIGDRVSVKANATVAAGVTLGDESVVGANSFVRKDVPPRTIASGVPAEIVGPHRRFADPDSGGNRTAVDAG
ncbi:MAG TPA: DapH/DapD/GlmU-related protein [Baekduia sp.]